MKPFLLALSICFSLMIHAQKRSPLQYKRAFTFNPSLLAGVDYTAMLGVEHRLKNNVGLVLDAGYVFHSSYFGSDKIRSANGYNLRPGIRWYMKQGREYLQMQLFYKQVNYTVHDWLGKDCVDRVPTYEQLQNFAYRKKAIALNMMVGELYNLSDDLYLEIYAGIGLKYKMQGPTEANSCYLDQDGNVGFDMYNEKSVTPNVPIGLKLVYVFKR